MKSQRSAGPGLVPGREAWRTRVRSRFSLMLALSLAFHVFLLTLELTDLGSTLRGFALQWNVGQAPAPSLVVRLESVQQAPAPPIVAPPTPLAAAEPARRGAERSPRADKSFELRPQLAEQPAPPRKRTTKQQAKAAAPAIEVPTLPPAILPSPQPPVLALDPPQEGTFTVPPPALADADPAEETLRMAEVEKQIKEQQRLAREAQVREDATRLAEAERQKEEEAAQEAQRLALETESRKRAEDATRREETEQVARLAAEREAQARRKAEEETRRRAEGERRKAEEAQQLALEEARRKAESERRKEEEARQQAFARQQAIEEEARRLALELETRRQAAEAARLEAEELERQRALALRKEQEAKRLALEEARRKAEGESRKQEEARRLALEEEARRQEQARLAREAEAREEATRQAEAERRKVEEARQQAAARQQEIEQRRAAEAAARAEREALAARQAPTPRGDDGPADAPSTPGAPSGRDIAARALGRLRTPGGSRDGPPRGPFPGGRPDSPRRRAVIGVERDIIVRLYVESWRAKIERNGTLNYRSSAGAGKVEHPLVTVAIRSDGSLEDVHIHRSSGRELDGAVRRIAMLHAPYSAFPPELARQFDVIEIRRVWLFEDTLRLREEMN